MEFTVSIQIIVTIFTFTISFVTLIILIARFSDEKASIYHGFYAPVGITKFQSNTSTKKKTLHDFVCICFSVSITNPSSKKIGFFSLQVMSPAGNFIARVSTDDIENISGKNKKLYYPTSVDEANFSTFSILEHSESRGYLEPYTAHKFDILIHDESILKFEYVTVQFVLIKKSLKRFIPLKKYRRQFKIYKSKNFPTKDIKFITYKQFK